MKFALAILGGSASWCNSTAIGIVCGLWWHGSIGGAECLGLVVPMTLGILTSISTILLTNASETP